MPGISLPDLVQRIKIDTKDMTLAAERATAFGTKMRRMSKDIDDASKSIDRSLAGINRDMDANLRETTGVQRDFQQQLQSSRREVDAFSRSIGDLPDSKMTDIDVDTTGAAAKLNQLDREIGSRHPEIGVGLEVDDYEYRALQQRLRNAQLEVGVEAELKTAKIRAQMEALERKRQVEIEAEIDGAAKVEAEMAVLARDRHSKIHVTTDRNNLQQIANQLGAITTILSGTGSAAGFSFLTRMAIPAGVIGGIQALIPLVGALGASLVDLSQAALVAPAGISMLGAAVTPLALGLKGMTDATDKWTKGFISNMGKVGDQWDKLRLTLRKDLLGGLDRQLSRLSKTAIPALTGGLRGIAQAWNDVAERVIKWAGAETTMSRINTVLKGTKPLIDMLGVGLTQFLNGFLNLSVAGIPVMQRIGKAFTDLMTKFNNWTAATSKGGGLTKMMNDGVDAVGRLWAVVVDLWDAIAGMNESAKMAGVDFIDTLKGISGWLKEFFNNPIIQRGFASAFEGVAALIDGIFGSMRPLASIFGTLGEVTKGVFTNLGDIAASVLPYLADGFRNLGPAIVDITSMMGPFQEVIHAIGPAFVRATASIAEFGSNVADFIGGAVADLAPVVKNIADTISEWLPKAFAVGKAAMDAFGAAIAFVAPGVSALVDILRPIVSAILDFAGALIRVTGPLLPIMAGLWGLHKVFVALKAAIMGTALAKSLIGITTAVKGLAFGPVTAQMGGFATGLGRVVEALKVGTLNGAGFKAVLGSMLGGLSYVTIALMAAAGGFLWFTQHQANAIEGGKEFAATLDKTTGAITAASQEWVKNKLFEDVTDPKEWVGFKQAGVDINEMSAAIAAGGPALDNYRTKFDALRAAAKAAGGWQAELPWTELGNAFNFAAKEADNGRGSIEGAGEALDGAFTSAQTLTDALTKVGEETSTATSEVQKYSDTLARLNNPTLAARAAERDWLAAIQESNEARKEHTKEIAKGNDVLNKSTAEGRAHMAVLDGIAESAMKNIAAAEQRGASEKTLADMLASSRDQLIKQATAWGMSDKEAAAYADTVLGIPKEAGTTITVFSDTALQAIADFNLALYKLPTTTKVSIDSNGNLVTTDINGVVTALGRLPKNTKLVIQADGTAALVPVQNLNAEIAKIPKGTHVDLTADGSQATYTINGVTTTLGNLPPGKQFTITADGSLAITEIGKVNATNVTDKSLNIAATDNASSVMRGVNEYPLNDPRNIWINGDNSNAIGAIGAVNAEALLDPRGMTIVGDPVPAKSAIDGVNTYPLNPRTTTLSANPAPAKGSIDSVNRYPLNPRSTTINANPSPFYTTAGRVANWSATVWVDIKARTYGPFASGYRFPSGANGMMLDGKGLQTFAGGGIEAHDAQIARGGWPYRLWAEPETGGEAYIPLALAKRNRSREIWLRTAKYLGYDSDLLRMFIEKRFASGGLLGNQLDQVRIAQARMMPYYTPAAQAGRGAKAEEVQPKEVHYHFLFEVHNPLPESSSETAVKQMTRLGTLGVFGG